ncbi:pentatricopeptide repeat-containing protein At1g31920 [Olea europaea var. sylvestris]|uniref:pentatricopeptide repeat-containing protein At1g31920 n=1 Tax=Olea europaea var. sylvestris TaxID=158386 RepID=UPI000C1D89DB|nr:pentatricopeptide repeat-containing protein At1g31920 [Olea europaea var. sylvestris]XP_022875459.1 pentatricopeptide repeat-containing protein At1g31920 [Olea europaea var. sylvestris]XP_022875460.1 pentatricopeptide repeat-containing protein At1g31920 [Olea europaea var. sylvestris]
MVGSSVLHQPKLLIPTHRNGLEIESDSKREQDCIFLLKKCTSVEELKQVHAQILKLGLFCKSFCASNLVSTCALSEWGSMDYACSIFKHRDDPDSFDFNTMIRGHIKHMNLEQALFTYLEMLHSGIEPDNFTYPALLKACTRLSAVDQGMQIHGQIFKLGFVDDVFVQNSLINMYGKCGDIKRSCVVFEQMEDSRKTIASWSSVISAYASTGMWSECLRLFGEMNEIGLRAEESILVNVLCACTHLGALDLAMCTHGYLLRNLTGLNVIVETTLIDVYMKCGFPDRGLLLFEKMSERNQMSHSVVISGLAIHGRAQEAFKIFEQMIEQGLKPDDVIYVGVLSACNHAGLVQEGFKYFDKLRFEHRIQPTIQHFGCMVDLMGRAGMIDEAIELIRSMPMEPNDVLWRSLLSSCKIHQNVELGEFAAKNLFQLNSRNASDYILISNMYAKAQRWHDVSMTRTEMANKGLINQVPGYSLVEVKKKMYKFVSNDTSHSQVYEMLHQMEWQLKFEGYSPDTSRVLLDVDEDEKRQRLSSHSQKLAIAFALIHTSHTSRIRIVRNVRMCSDCHTYTKLISTIYEREIIVRDRNRFHHFKDGTCSCGDYW